MEGDGPIPFRCNVHALLADVLCDGKLHLPTLAAMISMLAHQLSAHTEACKLYGSAVIVEHEGKQALQFFISAGH